MRLICVFLLLAFTGCARGPVTPEQEYEREDAMNELRENYLRRLDQCRRRGGYPVIIRSGDPVLKDQRAMHTMRCSYDRRGIPGLTY